MYGITLRNNTDVVVVVVVEVYLTSHHKQAISPPLMYWVSKGSTVYLHVLKNILKKKSARPPVKKMSMLVEPHQGVVKYRVFYDSLVLIAPVTLISGIRIHQSNMPSRGDLAFFNMVVKI